VTLRQEARNGHDADGITPFAASTFSNPAGDVAKSVSTMPPHRYEERREGRSRAGDDRRRLRWALDTEVDRRSGAASKSSSIVMSRPLAKTEKRFDAAVAIGVVEVDDLRQCVVVEVPHGTAACSPVETPCATSEGAFGVAVRAPSANGHFRGSRVILDAEHGADLSKATPNASPNPLHRPTADVRWKARSATR